MVEGFTSANIVIDTSLDRLYIIDFGLAQRIQCLDSEGRSSGLHPKSKMMAIRTAQIDSCGSVGRWRAHSNCSSSVAQGTNFKQWPGGVAEHGSFEATYAD
jgi:hypothetical protein